MSDELRFAIVGVIAIYATCGAIIAATSWIAYWPIHSRARRTRDAAVAFFVWPWVVVRVWREELR